MRSLREAYQHDVIHFTQQEGYNGYQKGGEVKSDCECQHSKRMKSKKNRLADIKSDNAVSQMSEEDFRLVMDKIGKLRGRLSDQEIAEAVITFLEMDNKVVKYAKVYECVINYEQYQDELRFRAKILEEQKRIQTFKQSDEYLAREAMILEEMKPCTKRTSKNAARRVRNLVVDEMAESKFKDAEKKRKEAEERVKAKMKSRSSVEVNEPEEQGMDFSEMNEVDREVLNLLLDYSPEVAAIHLEKMCHKVVGGYEVFLEMCQNGEDALNWFLQQECYADYEAEEIVEELCQMSLRRELAEELDDESILEMKINDKLKGIRDRGNDLIGRQREINKQKLDNISKNKNLSADQKRDKRAQLGVHNKRRIENIRRINKQRVETQIRAARGGGAAGYARGVAREVSRPINNTVRKVTNPNNFSAKKVGQAITNTAKGAASMAGKATKSVVKKGLNSLGKSINQPAKPIQPIKSNPAPIAKSGYNPGKY